MRSLGRSDSGHGTSTQALPSSNWVQKIPERSCPLSAPKKGKKGLHTVILLGACEDPEKACVYHKMIRRFRYLSPSRQMSEKLELMFEIGAQIQYDQSEAAHSDLAMHSDPTLQCSQLKSVY